MTVTARHGRSAKVSDVHDEPESELIQIVRVVDEAADAAGTDRGGLLAERPRDAAQLHDRSFLNALGVAVYTTDADGRITFFNEAAARLWGRRPELGEEWCGSLRLFWPDGRPMRHDECPMAIALREDRAVRGARRSPSGRTARASRSCPTRRRCATPTAGSSAP